MSRNIATEVFRHGASLLEAAEQSYKADSMELPLGGSYDFLDDDVSVWRVHLRQSVLGNALVRVPLFGAPDRLTEILLDTLNLSGKDARCNVDVLGISRTPFRGEKQRIRVEQIRGNDEPVQDVVLGHVMKYTERDQATTTIGVLTAGELRGSQSRREVASPLARAAIEQFLEVKPEHLRLQGGKTEALLEAEFRELHTAFSGLVRVCGETLATTNEQSIRTSYHFNLGNRYQAVLTGTDQEVGMNISVVDTTDPLRLSVYALPEVSFSAHAKYKSSIDERQIGFGSVGMRMIRLKGDKLHSQLLGSEEKAYLAGVFKTLCSNPEAAVVEKLPGPHESAALLRAEYYHKREIARLMQPEVPIDLSPVGLY